VPNDSDYIASPAGSTTVTVELRQGTTLIATRSVTPVIGVTETHVFPLTSDEFLAISDFTALAIWLTKESSTVKLQLTALATPGDTTAILYVRVGAV
jgi:hypothetical protein